MKKSLVIISLLLSLLLSACSSAEPVKPTARVTIYTQGEVQLADQPVEITDADGDGQNTINDLLITAHQQYAPNKQDDYATATSTYGLGITKLWGSDNNGGYGYFVNDGMGMSLTDPIAEGDHLVAYTYSDTTGFSDRYAYFDIKEAEIKAGDSVTLTASYQYFDENFATQKETFKNVAITIDGTVQNNLVTDDNGTVTVTFDKGGIYAVSMASQIDSLSVDGAPFYIVPPLAIITVK